MQRRDGLYVHLAAERARPYAARYRGDQRECGAAIPEQGGGRAASDRTAER